jgi:hypothetical protein
VGFGEEWVEKYAMHLLKFRNSNYFESKQTVPETDRSLSKTLESA